MAERTRPIRIEFCVTERERRLPDLPPSGPVPGGGGQASQRLFSVPGGRHCGTVRGRSLGVHRAASQPPRGRGKHLWLCKAIRSVCHCCGRCPYGALQCAGKSHPQYRLFPGGQHRYHPGRAFEHRLGPAVYVCAVAKGP